MPIITVKNCPNAVDPPRSKRFSNRHTPAAVAQELGIPQAWIWFWAWSKKLNCSQWLGKAWVNLEQARELASDIKHADLAYEATSEPIRAKKGADLALSSRMPDEFSYLVEVA